jgi:hypothetical protein
MPPYLILGLHIQATELPTQLPKQKCYVHHSLNMVSLMNFNNSLSFTHKSLTLTSHSKKGICSCLKRHTDVKVINCRVPNSTCGPCDILIQSETISDQSRLLKMDEAGFSKTLFTYYQTTGHHIQEDCNLKSIKLTNFHDTCYVCQANGDFTSSYFVTPFYQQ